MKLTIDKHSLDDSYEGTLELEAAIFAFQEKSDDCHDKDCQECGKPTYLFFVDTTEYDNLWKETTKDFKPTEDWRPKLKTLYQKDPGLEQRLSKQAKYLVPAELLQISHDEGGGHGDLRLRYKDAIVLFFPLKEFEWFKSEFSKDWDALLYNKEMN